MNLENPFNKTHMYTFFAFGFIDLLMLTLLVYLIVRVVKLSKVNTGLKLACKTFLENTTDQEVYENKPLDSSCCSKYYNDKSINPEKLSECYNDELYKFINDQYVSQLFSLNNILEPVETGSLRNYTLTA